VHRVESSSPLSDSTPTTVPASSEKPALTVCWEKLGWGGRIQIPATTY